MDIPNTETLLTRPAGPKSRRKRSVVKADETDFIKLGDEPKVGWVDKLSSLFNKSAVLNEDNCQAEDPNKDNSNAASSTETRKSLVDRAKANQEVTDAFLRGFAKPRL